MTRCQTAYPPRLGILLPLLRAKLRNYLCITTLLCTTLTAQAQMAQVLTLRPFPANAQRATMQVLQPPVLLLNGQFEQLSPGSRIRGTNNMLVMSGALVGQTLLVNFVREPQGLIHNVWILNEAEAQTQATPSQPVPNTLQP